MIIHIEAEGTPKNTIEKTAPISTVTPGSLNFMDTDEQQRVRKLLDSLKSSEAKDMDTQTEDTSELGKYFEKCVQTECLNPGNCSGMMSYLQQINKKLGMLISRQGNLKLLTTPSTPAHIPVPNSHTNFGEDRETLSSLALPSIGFDVPAETERKYDHHTMSDDVSPVSTINLADLPDLTQITAGSSTF